MFPPVVTEQLGKLQTKMPPFCSKTARAMIETELGARVDELFAELSEEPIAAASLGQVYRGRLRTDGTRLLLRSRFDSGLLD